MFSKKTAIIALCAISTLSGQLMAMDGVKKTDKMKTLAPLPQNPDLIKLAPTIVALHNKNSPHNNLQIFEENTQLDFSLNLLNKPETSTRFYAQDPLNYSSFEQEPVIQNVWYLSENLLPPVEKIAITRCDDPVKTKPKRRRYTYKNTNLTSELQGTTTPKKKNKPPKSTDIMCCNCTMQLKLASWHNHIKSERHQHWVNLQKAEYGYVVLANPQKELNKNVQ